MLCVRSLFIVFYILLSFGLVFADKKLEGYLEDLPALQLVCFH